MAGCASYYVNSMWRMYEELNLEETMEVLENKILESMEVLGNQVRETMETIDVWVNQFEEAIDSLVKDDTGNGDGSLVDNVLEQTNEEESPSSETPISIFDPPQSVSSDETFGYCSSPSLSEASNGSSDDSCSDGESMESADVISTSRSSDDSSEVESEDDCISETDMDTGLMDDKELLSDSCHSLSEASNDDSCCDGESMESDDVISTASNDSSDDSCCDGESMESDDVISTASNGSSDESSEGESEDDCVTETDMEAELFEQLMMDIDLKDDKELVSNSRSEAGKSPNQDTKRKKLQRDLAFLYNRYSYLMEELFFADPLNPYNGFNLDNSSTDQTSYPDYLSNHVPSKAPTNDDSLPYMPLAQCDTNNLETSEEIEVTKPPKQSSYLVEERKFAPATFRSNEGVPSAISPFSTLSSESLSMVSNERSDDISEGEDEVHCLIEAATERRIQRLENEDKKLAHETRESQFQFASNSCSTESLSASLSGSFDDISEGELEDDCTSELDLEDEDKDVEENNDSVSFQVVNAEEAEEEGDCNQQGKEEYVNLTLNVLQDVKSLENQDFSDSDWEII